MDAGNLLKPMLAGVSCTASAPPPWTSTASISKRTRLWAAVQPVLVDQPTVGDPSPSSGAWKGATKVYHGVKITDAAIVAAATLSHRYISDRFLRFKAIDLIDEGCALIRTEMDSMPTELDVVHKIIRCVEEAALKKRGGPRSKARLAELQEGAGGGAGSSSTQKGPVGKRRKTPSAGCSLAAGADPRS